MVRPLAHELYAEVGIDSRSARPERTRVTIAAVIEQASVADPFLPGTTVLITGTLLAGQVLFGQHNAMGSLATIISLGLMYVFLWAARRYLTPQMPRLPLGVRWLVIAVVGAIFAAGITLGAISLLSESIHINIVVMTVYIVALGDFLLFAIALGPGLASARDQVIADLAESNRTLRWQNARLNAQLLAEQKTVARALHRDVQGVLVAASLRLENAIRSGEPIDQASAEVRELVELATNFAIARQPVALHSAIVDSVREMWQGVLEIHLDAEPTAAERLDLDPIARQSFAEALGEFCVDSVKHGRAHSIHITITMESNDALLLGMVNDGAPLPDGAPTGLGSQLLASSLISFRRGNISGGVEVRATLPVAELSAT